MVTNAEDGEATALARRLRAAGCVFAEDEAAVLLGTGASGEVLDALVARRCAGEPLEQVVGWAEFDGLRLAVAPGVFVPRRRTRLLVDLAAELVATTPSATVVDACCGVGAIAAALLARAPSLDVHAADLDEVAVACARRNLPPGRVHQGDLLDALPASLRGSVAVVVANAPYVPTSAIATMPSEARDHEARLALDGGDDGLALHRRLADQAPGWLRAGGALVVETSVRQRDADLEILRAAGFVAHAARDEERDATAVVGRLP